MRWPVGFWYPETKDRWLVGATRALGLLSLLMFLIAGLGIIALVQALANPIDGWQGVVVALIIGMGLGALLLGGALSWLAHAAAHAATSPPVRIGAWALTAVGLTFWWPLLTKAPTAPIDHYLALLRLGLLALGSLMAWRISRSRSPQA